MKNANYGGHLNMLLRRRLLVSAALVTLAVTFVMMQFTGCAESGAEKQIKSELEAMRNIELDEVSAEELENILSDEGRENFKTFKKKAGEFEYEILRSSPSEDKDDASIIVTVRIRTYSFGREYLKTWTEYLEKRGEEDFSQPEFYEMLMKNLSTLESKGYFSDVDIVCFDPVDDGNRRTDVKTNSRLKDAILGGMMAEIAALAQE